DEERLAVEALYPASSDRGTSRGLPEEGSAADEDPSAADETVVAGDLLGTLPLKVTAIGGGAGRADLSAPLGTLPGLGQTEDLTAILAAAEDEIAPDQISVSWAALQPASTQEPREVPDYLFAVCALVLGLGLSSGPLFPDLLALVPSRPPRGRRALMA